MIPTARRAEIEEVFEQALELEPEARGAWLRDRCGQDTKLRAEVDALLAAHERAGGILDQRLPAIPTPGTPSLRDRRIGPYRVVRELGRGGMGVVYLAERVDGEFHREVAIKLLRNSPDAEELHRRFIAERQILASMSHPNIAQLLDGGTTDGELPYLVMEYVDGLPITTYCDRHGLDIAARLRLFVDVCRAVNSAHQNLVIHRDIKPGNILVTATGQVKLLDFGIAKLLNAGMGGMSVPHTRTAFRVMTPEYASPEQVRGEPLTTGSDVYSLGIVLYELLTGRRPYYIKTGAQRELHELVCEREPERPSTWATRLPAADDPVTLTPAVIASARGTSPDRLRRTLAGDLDAIVMMALRKEPRRRYGSSELLAEDIERHLGGLPVFARHSTRAYQLTKFLRRHRTATTFGAAAVLALLASTAVAVKQTITARHERDRATTALSQARQALHESEEMTNFLAGLFDVNMPTQGGGAPGTTEELLARGVGQIAQLVNRPLTQARMLEGMARIYQNAGRLDESKAASERSLALRRANGGAETAQTATSLVYLANTLRMLGNYVAADSAAWEAVRISTKINGASDPSVIDAWHMLSMVAVYHSDLRASEDYARRALDIGIAAYGPDDPRIAYSLEMYGGTLFRLGRYEEAEGYSRRAIALYERERGAVDPSLIVPLYRLAQIVVNRENLDEAVRIMERAVAVAKVSLGENHPRSAYAIGLLGEMESRRGNFATAEKLSRQAVDIFRRTLSSSDVALADAYADLAQVYARAKRWTDAEAAQRVAMRIYEEVRGHAHPVYAGALAGMCETHFYAGRLALAEAECRESMAIRTRAQGARTFGLLPPLMLLGDMRLQQRDLAAADSFYSAGLSIIQEHAGDQTHTFDYVYPRIAALRELQHRPAEAAEMRRKGGGKPVRPLGF